MMTTSPSENLLLTYALLYARAGWPVLPLHMPNKNGCTCARACDSPGKHPRWHQDDLPNGVHSATTDEDLIRKWWSRWPASNVGVATGHRSFDVLDCDLNDEVNGLQTLIDLELGYGERIPPTTEQITGGGGRQFFFQYSGSIPNSVRFKPGLDTRSDGGYVVLPPSLHASGKRYKWHTERGPDKIGLANCPQWLIEEIKKGVPTHVPKRTPNKPGWAVKALKGVEDGTRDDTGIRLAGYFFGQGLLTEEILEILLMWNERNSPPMSTKQVEKIVRSATRWEDLIENKRPGHGTIKIDLVRTG